MQRFSPGEHYVQGHDYKIDAPRIFMLNRARVLIAQYYQHKYNTNIIFLRDFSELKQVLAHEKRTQEINRLGFVIGDMSGHAVPIIYVRENAEEALLYFDSVGHDEDVYSQLKASFCFPIYTVKDKRQVDNYTCFIDAIIILRDCTRQDDQNNYFIPNLLQKIQERMTATNDVLYVKLPNALLKTAQQPKFIANHEEKSNEPVHKDQTLKQFHQRYFFRSTTGRNVNAYSVTKTIKLANIAEIQFYLNELRQKLGILWTESHRKEFIFQAKCTFEMQGDFFLNSSRAGLYALAQDFSKKISALRFEEIKRNPFEDSSRNQARLIHIAETLLQIITDTAYWQSKNYMSPLPPSGIREMQDDLKKLPENATLQAKIFAVRKIAQQRLDTTNIFFLLAGIHVRSEATDNIYKIFMKDWLTTDLFDRIYKDWIKPRDKLPVPLASMEMYSRVHPRF